MITKTQEQKIECLCFIKNILEDKQLLWAVTGSMNLFLHGISSINPSDIDIITTEEGINLINDVLNIYITVPLDFREALNIRSFFAVLQIQSVRVEVMAKVEAKILETWMPSHSHWENNIEHCKSNNVDIPCLSFDYKSNVDKKIKQSKYFSVFR